VADVLTEKYLPLFEPLLDDDELLVAGLGVHVQTAEVHGRGSGEGVLGISRKQVLFVIESTREPVVTVPRRLVLEARSSWIITPGMRQLELATAIGAVNVYASKRMCREVAAMLST
jgi:hypothetical protein